MPVESDRLYHELGHLITEMPDLTAPRWNTAEALLWLGRASALIEQCGDAMDEVAFRSAANSLSDNPRFPAHIAAVSRIAPILYRALARAERRASTASQGSFIPVGQVFSAFTNLSKILSKATSSVMFVDPYADASLLTDFAVLVPEGVSTRILADAGSRKPTLSPALGYWLQQYGAARPMEVRLATARSLHDRLIIVDEQGSWSLGQSFNALATRAHTSLMRADPETAQLKIQAHNLIWQESTPIQ